MHGALEPLDYECTGLVQGLDGNAPRPITSQDTPFFRFRTHQRCCRVQGVWRVVQGRLGKRDAAAAA